MGINYKLQQILKEKGVSVNSLAREARIPASNIYKIINCKNKNPGIYTIKKIADVLRINIEDLL